jgi:hypothetical protein
LQYIAALLQSGYADCPLFVSWLGRLANLHEGARTKAGTQPPVGFKQKYKFVIAAGKSCPQSLEIDPRERPKLLHLHELSLVIGLR